MQLNEITDVPNYSDNEFRRPFLSRAEEVLVYSIFVDGTYRGIFGS